MIRAAEADELGAVGELIAVAFDDLAANHYLVPTAADRIPILSRFFALLSEPALGHGRVDVIDGPDGLAATAVWFDYTSPMPEQKDLEKRIATLAGPYAQRFGELGELLTAHHPHDRHWHLAFLAVQPSRQGAGLGGALMRRTHDDLAGVPTYLEATNADNVRLYRRAGYREMDPFAVFLPDGAAFYRMWREAS